MRASLIFTDNRLAIDPMKINTIQLLTKINEGKSVHKIQ